MQARPLMKHPQDGWFDPPQSPCWAHAGQVSFDISFLLLIRHADEARKPPVNCKNAPKRCKNCLLLHTPRQSGKSKSKNCHFRQKFWTSFPYLWKRWNDCMRTATHCGKSKTSKIPTAVRIMWSADLLSC